MRRARIALAGSVAVIAGAALAWSAYPGQGSSTGGQAASVAGFLPIDHGVRRGVVLAGVIPGVGSAAVYEPAAARDGHRVRVVYIVSGARSPAATARAIRLASTGDQLVWDATVPPFVAVVAPAASLARLAGWAHAALPIAPERGRVVLLSAAIAHGSLADALTRALQSPRARAAAAASARVISPHFNEIQIGPDGGTVWQGRIPGAAVPALRRTSLVYLPPGVRRGRRYPLVILLHGLRGSPYSFAGGLRLPQAVDPMIARGRLRPFIAVMPPAGLTAGFDGEWTGAWERYVIHDVLPWALAHLPVERAATHRVIAGFSAGGYGAVDMALRHPHMFGVAESWSGYFAAPHDGSLRGASRRELAAHSPIDLVTKVQQELRARGVRFLLSAGRHERQELRDSRRFARELARLHVPSRLLVTQGGHDGKQWHAVLRAGLAYALGRRSA